MVAARLKVDRCHAPTRTFSPDADAHFDRIAAASPEQVLCRKGCSLCCYGLFEIAAADVSLIVDAFARLPIETQQRLADNARRQAETFQHPDLRTASPEEKEAFFARTEGVPCRRWARTAHAPFTIRRPLVCRTFGLPLRDGPRFIGDVCELNFTTASQEEMETAAWDLQREDVLGPDDEFTVPEAILLAARLHGL